jgi:hypothetical protein
VLGDAVRRPSAFIDCTEPELRAAAFAALDSKLSHAGHQQPETAAGVLLMSVSWLNADLGTAHYEYLMAELLYRLSPCGRSNRCLLRLCVDALLICALDSATDEQLSEEVSAAQAHPSLGGISLTTSPIRTSLELQSLARQTADRGHIGQQGRVVSRVH